MKIIKRAKELVKSWKAIGGSDLNQEVVTTEVIKNFALTDEELEKKVKFPEAYDNNHSEEVWHAAAIVSEDRIPSKEEFFENALSADKEKLLKYAKGSGFISVAP